MKAAVESGATFWNGADMYGTPEYNSMTLLNHYFARYPEDADKVTVVIKGGTDLATMAPAGSSEMIRKSVDSILAQLGGNKKLDMFGLNRRDHSVPLETTLGILQKEYVDTGKIGGIALSECSAATIHEAARHIKVAAVEVELSMLSRDILTNGVAAACAEHGIPIVAYSPTGRGVSSKPFSTTSRFSRY